LGLIAAMHAHAMPLLRYLSVSFVIRSLHCRISIVNSIQTRLTGCNPLLALGLIACSVPRLTHESGIQHAHSLHHVMSAASAICIGGNGTCGTIPRSGHQQVTLMVGLSHYVPGTYAARCVGAPRRWDWKRTQWRVCAC